MGHFQGIYTRPMHLRQHDGGRWSQASLELGHSQLRRQFRSGLLDPPRALHLERVLRRLQGRVGDDRSQGKEFPTVRGCPKTGHSPQTVHSHPHRVREVIHTANRESVLTPNGQTYQIIKSYF